MNSELTRKLIERRIANNNEGIAAMDRDGISNHLQRELYDGWKQDNAIYEFALVGLSVQPRLIAEEPKYPNCDCIACGGDGIDSDPMGMLDYSVSLACPSCWSSPLQHQRTSDMTTAPAELDAAEMSVEELDKIIAIYDESFGGPHEDYPIARAWVRAFQKSGYLSPDQLAIRDAETTRRALEMAANAAYKWWDGEPEDAIELKSAILALKPAPTGWKLVPEELPAENNKKAVKLALSATVGNWPDYMNSLYRVMIGIVK